MNNKIVSRIVALAVLITAALGFAPFAIGLIYNPSNSGSSIPTPVSIANGGTATTTLGVTNGVIYNNGNNWTNGGVLTFDGSTLMVLDTNGIVSGVSGGPSLTLLSTSGYGELQTFNSKPIVLNDQGNNVGIGLTTPGYKLEVSGTGRFSSTVDVGNLVSTSTSIASTFGYRVGIATSSPTGSLSVGGASFGTTNGVCYQVKATGSASAYVYYYFTAAATQVISSTSCNGAGTTTITTD